MVIKQPLFIFIVFAGILFFCSSCQKEYSCEKCIPDLPPIARAGTDTTLILPANSVLLNGNLSSDPDGIIVSFQWRKISGPASLTLVSPQSAQTQANDLASGTYLFELEVTDKEMRYAKDTIAVTIIFSSCTAEDLHWTLADNGMMALINPANAVLKATLYCGGGIETLVPVHYDVLVRGEGSSDWVHLQYVFRDAIASTDQMIFLSSTLYQDPDGNQLSFPVVYAKPNAGIDFTKTVTVINTKVQ